MNLPVSISSALISVYYKDNLAPIIELLHKMQVQIYSTGGTEKFISDLGIPVQRVEDLTEYPSILGGRVKTLHPKVFGGILGRRHFESDLAQMEEFQIPKIDLVIVDLYPFEETLRKTSDEAEIIEKIDIGGVSLIRAAAKNYQDVIVIASKEQYSSLEQILKQSSGISSLEQRKYFAQKAFAIISEYDLAIQKYFETGDAQTAVFETKTYAPKHTLRYGENPHQEAAFYGHLESTFEQLHGKEISYNNLVDIESSMLLMEDFADESQPVFAILKHTNTCGLAIAESVSEAYSHALAADPLSAFGGVLISNKKIDKTAAEKIHELFFEVLTAPAYDDDALEILTTKKNRIILIQKQKKFNTVQFKSMFDGVLVQDRNIKTSSEVALQIATVLAPSPGQMHDLLIAEKIVKHLKSNGIAIVKNSRLIGSGTGQTSRVDALAQAITKAKHFGFEIEEAVMASEAFFPFPDCVELAFSAGIKAVIQPGGSIRDKDSIDFCNTNNMAMVLTGIRHFKH